MRDISPSEREVLERAAQHVRVFERVPNEAKTINHDPGCFDCSHNVGPMNVDAGYFTIEVVPLNSDFYDDPVNAKRIGLVCCMRDSFWRRIRESSGGSWQSQAFSVTRDITWPAVRQLYLQGTYMIANPEVYVRSWAIHTDVDNKKNIHHVNSKINLMDLLDLDAEVVNAEFQLSITSSRWNGIYYDPRFALMGAEEVNRDGLRVGSHEAMTRVNMILGNAGGPQLERISSKKTTKRKPKIDTHEEELVYNFPPIIDAWQQQVVAQMATQQWNANMGVVEQDEPDQDEPGNTVPFDPTEQGH